MGRGRGRGRAAPLPLACPLHPPQRCPCPSQPGLRETLGPILSPSDPTPMISPEWGKRHDELCHGCLLAWTISHLHLILRDPEANCICQTLWAVCACACVCVSSSYQARRQRLLKQVGIIAFNIHQEPVGPERKGARSGRGPSPRRRDKGSGPWSHKHSMALWPGSPSEPLWGCRRAVLQEAAVLSSLPPASVLADVLQDPELLGPPRSGHGAHSVSAGPTACEPPLQRGSTQRPGVLCAQGRAHSGG